MSGVGAFVHAILFTPVSNCQCRTAAWLSSGLKVEFRKRGDRPGSSSINPARSPFVLPGLQPLASATA
ncbi:MAG: hypothetical protein SNJ57_00655 [Cyanobacteriota bacterium]